MKQNNFFGLLKYEFLNTMGGFFTPIFGIVFPVFMGIILTTIIPSQVPEEYVKEVTTAISLTMATIIPLSIMLVSFPSTFAQEVEQKVIARLNFFNISEKKILLIKIIVNYAIMTIALLVYTIVLYLINKDKYLMPTFSSAFIFIFFLYLLATIYFVLAFSIANIFQKFGITYAITMLCYFATMFFSGMMGVQPDQLPGVLKTVSNYFPPSYMARDFANYWTIGFSGYNFAPLSQSLIFWGALAGICFFISQYKNKSKL